jgi:hypothetical protein
MHIWQNSLMINHLLFSTRRLPPAFQIHIEDRSSCEYTNMAPLDIYLTSCEIVQLLTFQMWPISVHVR